MVFKRPYYFMNIFILLLASLVFSGWSKKGPVKEEGPGAIPVRVMKVELQDIKETLDYVGNIKAQEEVRVFPKVTGKISEKVKDAGSLVEKGDPIVYIDRDEVGLKFEQAPVESPLSGIVGRVYVDIGSHVSSQTAVALVVDMDKVKIELDLPEKYLPKISIAQDAQIIVDAYPHKVFMGQVSKISPVLDLTTRTAPIEILADNLAHELKSGMFARVNLILEEHRTTPVILKEAVLGREPNFYVYVAENKKAVSRKIRLGIRQGPYWEVQEGLSQGEWVVIMGQQMLYDGAIVEPEE
ncbi:MAG: efflux RND transporter periplasmic adaptor subunit [Candidatus Omnitrophota bacterium]